MPDQKRARLEGGRDVTASARAGQIAYPDTDAQYAQSDSGPMPVVFSGSAPADAASDVGGALAGWREALDAATGARYIYNVSTRESSWGTEEMRV
jgi:hypothetical protein